MDEPEGLVQCEPDPDYTGIQLSSDQGAIPFDTIGGSLSVDAQGTCVVEGQLTLTDRGADRCRLTLNLSGTRNAAGWYLLRSAILTTDGSCPGFPETIRNGTYNPSAFESWGVEFDGQIESGGDVGFGCYRGTIRLHVSGNLEASTSASSQPQATTVVLDTQSAEGAMAAIHTSSSSEPCPVPL